MSMLSVLCFTLADEYILSKIAERDLRRFANLRLVSSELGARIPFDKVLHCTAMLYSVSDY